MKKGLMGGVAAIAVVAAAGASVSAAEPEASWTGPYVGAHVGWAFENTDVIVGTKNEEGHFWDIGDDINGVVGGFQLGFDTPVDTRLGSFVAGVVGDFSFADLDRDHTKLQSDDGKDQFVGFGSPVGGPPGKLRTSIDNLATIRLRLGVPTGDQTLFYVHGGLAMADFEIESQVDKGPFATVSDGGWELGWVGGVGVEHRIQDLIPAEVSRAISDISLFAEYSYMAFGDDLIVVEESGDFKGTVVREDRNLHMIKVGVNLRFDSLLSGNTRKTAANRHRPDAVASKMAPKKVSQAQPLAGERKPRTEDDAAASMMTPTLVSQAQPLARERKPRTENGAAASMMAPTLISQASPLARAPKPRTEVVAPAPPREPPRTVVPASPGLDTETRLVKLKVLYDRGLIGDRDYYEKRRQLSSGTSAAKDDLKAAAVQVGPEKKPGDQEPAVKPDDEMVKIVFATPGTRGGEVDRGSREYISWVQRSLNQILGTDLDVDGIMGRQTRGAVRSFQTEAGVGVDGTPGHHTEDALIKAGASPPRPG